MAEKIKKRVINLLPNKGDNVLNDFLSWALTVGRLLVIITETLALSVFLYRFSIDMQLVDLHGKIRDLSTVVSSFGESEKIYRNLIARLSDVHDANAESNKRLTIMTDVVALGKGYITFKTIIVSNKTLELEIQAPAAANLNAFTNKLKKYDEVTDISVDRVENKTSSAEVTVGMSAKLTSTKPYVEEADATDEKEGAE